MIRLESWAAPAIILADRIAASLAARLAPLIAPASRHARNALARLQQLARPLTHAYRTARQITRHVVHRATAWTRQLVHPPLAAVTRALSRVRIWLRSLHHLTRRN